MCKLTPLSTTKIVLSTNLERGNKIYIKVKKTWALCGRHDHRAALDNKGTHTRFQWCILRKENVYAIYDQCNTVWWYVICSALPNR